MKRDLLKFALDNIYLIAIALASGGMLLWPVLRRGAGGASVNTLEATQLINRQDALVLDVRNPEEFQKGHIMNARNIPLSQLDARFSDIARYKEKPVIVACESGNRSGGAAAVLRKKGFAQVYNLSGGIAAWQQAGLPVEK
jgi:rhodanese-related sulfurtransferase